jgi:putative colanic acid biosynthesis acetyltransferase WcaF
MILGDYVALGPQVRFYNVDKIIIGKKVAISQYAHLCSASHDIHKDGSPLITSPILIDSFAWVASDAYIGPGVTIGEGAVVAARGVVVKNIEPWTVVGGNPAIFIKKREIK